MRGLILIYNLHIESFLFHSSTIIPKTSISWVKIDNLEFSEIDLGESILNTVEVGMLYLDWASIAECKINDINFKWNYRLSEKRLTRINESNEIKAKIKISNRKLKDNYRQLKFLMDKNWNHTEANKFFAKEMEYYGNTLDIFNIPYSRIFNLNWWIFFLQLLISNFWNSWIRPILWILIFANLAIAYENNFIIFWIPDWIDFNWYSWNLVRYLTPFTELAKWEDISLKKFLYNILIIFLVYHFTVAIKRTTKR